MHIGILIPAYKPDEKLIQLLKDLGGIMPVVVVDDGSGDECAEIFEQAKALGACVLTHKSNRGKGAALKTGIEYIKNRNFDGVITADSDGQHTPSDIKKVAEQMEQMPGSFVVGGRDFSKMPLRSKFGNIITCWLFRLGTGIKIVDTQSGLRGIPSCIFDNMLEVEGDRYEYEMNILLALKVWKIEYCEIPISTVYIAGNKSSHFRPINDGLKVIIRVVVYILSSLSSTLADYMIYIALMACGLAPALNYAIAKVSSSVLNYTLNCKFVFHGKPSFKNVFGFALLVLITMTLGSFIVTVLVEHGLNGILAKMIIDTSLFVVNYIVQNKIIFAKKD